MKGLWYWLVGLCDRLGDWFDRSTNFWGIIVRFIVLFVIIAVAICIIGLLMMVLEKLGLEDISQNNDKSTSNWPYGGFGW